MKRLIKYLKELFAIYIVSNSVLTDEYLDNPVFKIAVATPYPVNDIMDFMALTGIKLKETEVLLKRFSEYGISNIKDVNTLAKLGYFHYC
tara:strand:+ start:206 stop:475 length:270 start_codon:yes stop_codon:yes gene_type:complete